MEKYTKKQNKPIFTDYYLSKFKWYRKLRKCNWYKHKFTKEALQLSPNFTGCFWALYGKINKYSNVIDIEEIESHSNNPMTPEQRESFRQELIDQENAKENL